MEHSQNTDNLIGNKRTTMLTINKNKQKYQRNGTVLWTDWTSLRLDDVCEANVNESQMRVARIP